MYSGDLKRGGGPRAARTLGSNDSSWWIGSIANAGSLLTVVEGRSIDTFEPTACSGTSGRASLMVQAQAGQSHFSEPTVWCVASSFFEQQQPDSPCAAVSSHAPANAGRHRSVASAKVSIAEMILRAVTPRASHH